MNRLRFAPAERSDGSAFLPPTPSCRAVLAWAGEFFGGVIIVTRMIELLLSYRYPTQEKNIF